MNHERHKIHESDEGGKEDYLMFLSWEEKVVRAYIRLISYLFGVAVVLTILAALLEHS